MDAALTKCAIIPDTFKNAASDTTVHDVAQVIQTYQTGLKKAANKEELHFVVQLYFMNVIPSYAFHNISNTEKKKNIKSRRNKYE